MNAVSIGSLRHQIEVQKRVRTSDGYGGHTNTWTTEANMWASVEPVSARESLFGMQLDHRVTHRVTLRYCGLFETAGFNTDYRIIHRDRTFNIIGKRDIEERLRYWVLDCEEGGAH